MLEVCYLSISSIRSQSLTEDLPLGKLKKKKSVYMHVYCMWCQNRSVVPHAVLILCLFLSLLDHKV